MSVPIRTVLVSLTTGWLLLGQNRTVEVNAAKTIGVIRPLQQVNNGPLPGRTGRQDLTDLYHEMRIDLIRTHDFFGPFDIDARWSDPDPIARAVRASSAETIFPDPDADPQKEGSYNFAPTDRQIKGIVDCGAGVYYRVGRSWSADPDPPRDMDKYAEVVKHVAMHYNHGWANGFHYGIRYWEIWNEPDTIKAWAPEFVRVFWNGTPPQFYTLYEKVARALKSYDPTLKVGGPGQAAGDVPGPYREGLIQYCAAHKVPLDFFSWHHYHQSTSDPYDMVRIGKAIRGLLDASGFLQAESHVTEWGLNAVPSNAPQGHSSMEQAAFMGAAQIYLQEASVDRSFYYRGDGTMGFLEPDGTPRKKVYVYKTLAAMLDTPVRLEARGGDTLGFAALAGKSADGSEVQVMLVNYEIPPPYRRPRLQNPFGFMDRRTGIEYSENRGYRLKVSGLGWGTAGYTVHRYRENGPEEIGTTHHGAIFELTADMPPPAVELIVLKTR